MIENAVTFRKKLIAWYLVHKRDLPWRATIDPYKIWLSEIILQQTRVAQGTPYYFKFIEAFPTVQDLANAPQEQVLKLWQGLGYYSRARNLHATAQYITTSLGGHFPTTYKGLLALKGVGDYTASAIGSICYGLPTAVVDGNVYRVLSRVYGVSTPINSTQGNKQFKALAQGLIDTKDPATFNQAIMEFGATHCVPSNPDCEACVFKTHCVAYTTNKVAVLPVKQKTLKVKKRHFNYIVILDAKNNTVLTQRQEKGIWQQLYQFPLVESSQALNATQLTASKSYTELKQVFQLEKPVLFNEKAIVHKLSHQHLYTTFWVVDGVISKENAIKISEIKNFAVPVLIENFITSFRPFK